MFSVLTALELMMEWVRRSGWLFFVVMAVLPIVPARAGEPFPFGSTLMLDTAPIRGSKRIPMIEIQENGIASIDLWCTRARAQATVADGSITIVPGDLQSAQCDAERQSRDANLLAALAQVTNWRRNGELVELIGVTPLRFRMMTN
jgi:hypothetical protein